MRNPILAFIMVTLTFMTALTPLANADTLLKTDFTLERARYTKAMETITNMTRANYFYITGYGNYSGYRIEQDPTLTIYMSTTATSTPTPLRPAIIAILLIAAIASIITIALWLHRKPDQQITSGPTKPQT